MKFLCPNCKAKYQIADEKVAGRTLRMDCRRCGNTITIRADMQVPDDDEVAVEAPPTGRGSAGTAPGARRPATASTAGQVASRGGSNVGPNPLQRAPVGRSATSSAAGSALGADFRKNLGAAPEAPRATPLDQWHVAIHDVPVGPIRRDEIMKKMAAGAVTGDSLCWREGFDDWRPLRDVPELAALLRKAQVPVGDERASRLPPAPATARGAGPTAARPAAAKSAPAAQRPAARSNVVPIGGRLGAAAAIDEQEDEAPADEPTRVGSFDLAAFEAQALASAEKKAEEVRRAEARATPRKEPSGKHESSEAKAPASRPEPARTEPAQPATAKPAEGRPDTGRQALPKPGLPKPGRPDSIKFQTAKAAPPPAAPPPEDDDDDLPIGEPAFAAPTAPIASAALAPAPLAPAPLASAPLASAPLASAPLASAPLQGPAPVAAAPDRERERRGGGFGWAGMAIGLVAAMAAGGVFTLVLQRQLGSTPPPVTAPATPTPAPSPPPVAAVEVPEAPTTNDAPAEAPTGEAPATEVAEAAPSEEGSSTSTSSRPRRPSTGSTAAEPTTAPAGAQAAQKVVSERFAAFQDSPSSSGPAVIAGATTARRPTDEESGGGGATELTADQIRTVITRERPVLNRCWETELRRIGQAATVRLDIDLTIGGSGTVTSVSTRGQTVGGLNECIERSVRRWRFPTASGSTQTSFPMVFSGT